MPNFDPNSPADRMAAQIERWNARGLSLKVGLAMRRAIRDALLTMPDPEGWTSSPARVVAAKEHVVGALAPTFDPADVAAEVDALAVELTA